MNEQRTSQVIERIYAARTLYDVLGLERSLDTRLARHQITKAKRECTVALHSDNRYSTKDSRMSEADKQAKMDKREMVIFAATVLSCVDSRHKYDALMDLHFSTVNLQIIGCTPTARTELRRRIVNMQVPGSRRAAPPPRVVLDNAGVSSAGILYTLLLKGDSRFLY